MYRGSVKQPTLLSNVLHNKVDNEIVHTGFNNTFSNHIVLTKRVYLLQYTLFVNLY